MIVTRVFVQLEKTATDTEGTPVNKMLELKSDTQGWISDFPIWPSDMTLCQEISRGVRRYNSGKDEKEPT